MNHLERLQAQSGMLDLDLSHQNNKPFLSSLADVALNDGLHVVEPGDQTEIGVEDPFNPNLVTWLYDEHTGRDQAVVTYGAIRAYSRAKTGSTNLGYRLVHGLMEIYSDGERMGYHGGFDVLGYYPGDAALMWESYMCGDAGLYAAKLPQLGQLLRSNTIRSPRVSEYREWGDKTIKLLQVLCDEVLVSKAETR